MTLLPRHVMRRPRTIRAAVFVWTCVIASGSLYGLFHETTPGITVPASPRWPHGTACRLSKSKPTLVMFLHPRCPCSHASLAELQFVLNRCARRVAAQAVFFRPQASTDEWVKTRLWEEAGQIPGLTRRIDPDGAERSRFGASLSGEVFVYHPDGGLAFRGGITASRGHAGENLGSLGLVAFLSRQAPLRPTTPVFGCELTSARCLAQPSDSAAQSESRSND